MSTAHIRANQHTSYRNGAYRNGAFGAKGLKRAARFLAPPLRKEEDLPNQEQPNPGQPSSAPNLHVEYEEALRLSRKLLSEAHRLLCDLEEVKAKTRQLLLDMQELTTRLDLELDRRSEVVTRRPTEWPGTK